MTRTAIFAALLGLMLVPAALAQDANESAERPDDAAWVDDCPPDMMCAAGADGNATAPDKEAPTYDGNCDGEVCVYKDEQPQAIGPEGCIECMGPVDPAPTCMDGAQEDEECQDDVQYMAPPAEAASDGGANKVPAPAVAASLAALGLAAVLLVARRR